MSVSDSKSIPSSGVLDIPKTYGEAMFEYKVPPRVCGIYFLMRGDKVAYVGQSVNVHRRILEHRDDKDKIFDRTVVMPVPLSELDRFESYAISILNPSDNGTRWVRPRSFMFSGRREFYRLLRSALIPS